MQTRSLRKVLTALLATAPGCVSTASTRSADAGADTPTFDDSPRDVITNDIAIRDDIAPDVVDAYVPVDVPDERVCGMCGCDFTGMLVGTGPIVAAHCRGDEADAGSASDADGDGAVDASSPDPTTCALNCDRACGGVMVSGFGLFRPWALPTIGGGSPGTCMRQTATTVRCVAYVPCGRRTEGQRDLAEDNSVGGYLRRAAWLEAQAEGAFERLTLELTAHGAPAALIRAARRSAREEARHAARMRAVCDRRGVRPIPAPEAPCAVRGLGDVAAENAAEGCAGETWGALLAMHQAATARDPDVRAAMADIARDEVRHAALSWAVHRWALGALDATSRARVERAEEDAWDALERAISADPPAHLAGPLGLPDALTALRLARALRASLQGSARPPDAIG